MKILASVQFDGEQEVQTFEQALKGHEHAISFETDKGLRQPVRAYLNRLRQEEPLDLVELDDLAEVLAELIASWAKETTPEAWREMGAMGKDDAIEGLAQERRFAIERAEYALSLLDQARERVIQASPERRVTKAERKAVEA